MIMIIIIMLIFMFTMVEAAQMPVTIVRGDIRDKVDHSARLMERMEELCWKLIKQPLHG